jgi:cytoskeletal protein CcmA (bactofilin family)
VVNLSTNATLALTGGNFTFPNNSQITGNGSVRVSGGNTTFTGNNTGSANIIVAGGTATFNGTTNTTGGATLSSGTLDGTGTLNVGGPVTLNGATLTGNGILNATAGATINGTFTLNGTRTLNLFGNSTWSTAYITGVGGSTITIQPNSTLTVTGDYYVYGGSQTATVNNQGTLKKTAGTGSTYFYGPFNNTGTLEVDSGSVALAGGGIISASSMVDLAAGTNLYLSGNYTIMDGFQFTGLGTVTQTAGTLTLDGLLKAGTFVWGGGNWDAANTSGLTTTIASGTTLTMAAINDGSRSFNGRTIANNGIVNWTGGYLYGGNGSSFVNNGAFNDQNASSYYVYNPYGGTFTFTNNGAYTRTTTGTTTFYVPFTNNGAINVSAGTLQFTNTFTNTSGGTLTAGSGATLQFTQGLTLAAGTLSGNGTVIGNVTAQGTVAPGASAGQLTITGNLSLLATAQLLIELGGPVQGTGYDFLSVSGTGALGGNLGISFLNGYQTTVTGADRFTVLTAGSALSGAFVNVPNGQRIFTTDGFGSFQVNYGTASAFATNSVVLSNFVPVPEPSTWALLLLGTGALAVVVRRRRK